MTRGIKQDLADTLGCTVESIEKLEVGFYPAKQVWVFPERDAVGNIVGLTSRTIAGNKFMLSEKMCPGIPASHRGLIYVSQIPGSEPYIPGAANWVHCTKDIPCPICGRIKYCMVSSENPDDPQAVLCTKIREGADPTYTSTDGQSYLHIRKAGGRKRGTSIPASDHPVIVVEGASDVLAATSLGFVGIGKPNDKGGHKYLVDRVGNRPVLVLGENDEAGRMGMANTHALLALAVKCGTMLPPPEYKDLRQWYVQGGLTKESFLAYVKEHAEWKEDNSRTFLEDDPVTIADKFLEQCHTIDNTVTLRYHRNRWVQWDGQKYVPRLPELVEGDLYRWLDKCKIVSVRAGKSSVEKYIASSARVTSILRAMKKSCPVEGDAPFWLIDDRPPVKDLVIFQNGILDVRTMQMLRNTPDLFSYNGLPFDYDPGSDYSWWTNLVSDIMGGDEDRIRLLQQWFGYNMVADVSQEKLMFFIGPPRSGKGTMTEALKTVLGQEQVAATDMDDMAGSFGYEHLMGKLCVTVGDLKTSGHTNVERALQRLLNITGEDGVTVNMKGKPAIPHVHLSCRFTISMNLLPALRDNANAIMPRLSFLRFPNSYVGREDRGLKAKIKSRGQAIATWALAGLLDLRSSGKFIEPSCDRDMLPQVKRLNSPMLAFVEDCCELGEEFTATKFDIRNMYKAWCKGGCYTVESEDMMRQHICAVCSGVRYGVKDVMDSKITTWIGIRVTEQAKKDYL